MDNEGMVAKGADKPDQDDGVFRRVVGYFLDHEKPEKPKPKRRPMQKKAAKKAAPPERDRP